MKRLKLKLKPKKPDKPKVAIRLKGKKPTGMTAGEAANGKMQRMGW